MTIQANPVTPTPQDPVRMLTAAAGAAKGQVDPRTVVAAAQTAKSPGEAATNVQAIAHTGNMVKLYDTLKAADPSEQAQGWQGLSPSEQESLKGLGYQPPNLAALTHAGGGGAHGSIWGDIAGGFSDALHTTESGIGRVAHDVNIGGVPGHVMGDVSNAAFSPLRAGQHILRAGFVEGEKANPWMKPGQGILGQIGQEITGHAPPGAMSQMWHTLTDPSSWAQAWHETTNGNTTLDPAQNRLLVNKYGQKKVSLAIRFMAAAGPGNNYTMGANAVVQGAPQAQRQALINQFQDPKFMELVSQVGNARISFGRMMVGSQFMDQHPGPGKLLSGSIDALTDLTIDPTMQTGKVADLLRAAGTTTAATDRLATQLEPLLAEGRYGELGRRYPQLAPLVPDLARMQVDSAEGFKSYVADKAGQMAMFAGGAPKLARAVAFTPHLTPWAWTKQGVKDLMSNSVNDLADGKLDNVLAKMPLDPKDVNGAGEFVTGHANKLDAMVDLLKAARIPAGEGRIPGVSNVARLVRRTSQLIADHNFIGTADALPDANGIVHDTGPDWQRFQRYVQGFLPRHLTDQATDLFLNSDEGERHELIMAGIKQNFHAQGLYNTDRGAQAADEWIVQEERRWRQQAYSVNGYDADTDEAGLPIRGAVTDSQISHGVRIPMPKEMRELVRTTNMLEAFHIHPMTIQEQLMHAWRVGVLDRPGFAVRIALEENTSRGLRMGFKNMLASGFANGARVTRTDEDIADQVEREVEAGTVMPADAAARTGTLKGLANKPLLPYHPGEQVLRILSEHISPGLRPFIDTPAKWYGAVFGGAARRWARQAERGGLKALGMDDYVNAGEHFAKYQPEGAQGVLDDVLARGNGDEGNVWSPEAQSALMRQGAKGVKAQVNRNAGWSTAGIGDLGYHFKWQNALNQIIHGKLSRAALETVDHDPETQVDAVKGVLADPEFAATKKAMMLTKKAEGGRRVGTDAEQSEADDFMARRVVNHVNAHVRSGIYGPANRGPVLRQVVDHMLEHGTAPDIETLEGIPAAELPHSVVGPDIVAVNKFAGFFQKSFHEMVGRPMNWLARMPHFLHQYADSLDDARTLARSVIGEGEEKNELVEKLASDLATQRAVNKMLPFIHNPQLRTQFEDMHRNLFPFLFAQRQFLQRWARVFSDSPEAIRKLQLTMNGLRTSGIVQRDQNGNDFFYYPGTQYVTELIANTFNALGVHTTIPFADPFSGETKYLVPGLSNPITPSVGPFAAVAMKEAEKFFPEVTGFNNAVLGQGAADSDVQQFLPTILNRLYTALGPAAAGTQLMTSAAQMVKYMDAAGHGLPSNPTSLEVQQYVSRLQNGAHSVLLARAALGFFLPASPTAQLDPAGLDARYKTLLSELPYDQATAEFVKEHPDASAYEVGSTTAETEGGLPSTAEDLAWTNQNLDFTRNHPAAAPWFAPRSPGTFSLTEFEEQLNTGERQTKPLYDATPGSRSVVTDIINARASGDYYASVNNYENAYAAAGGSAARASLTNAYDQWKADFMKQNPVFNEYIESHAGHVSRLETLRQVAQALKDPKAPPSPATEDLGAVMTSYTNFTNAYGAITGSSTEAYDQKQALKAQMISWVTETAKSVPVVTDFLNTIIRPEVDEQTG